MKGTMKKNAVCLLLPLLAACSLLASPAAVSAAAPESAGDEVIETLNQALRERDQVIRDLLQRMERLENEVQTLRGGSAPAASLPAASGGEDPAVSALEDASASPPLPPPVVDDLEAREEQDRFATAALERLLVQRNALLLPSWTMELEPSFTYAHSSTDRILIDGVTAVVDLPGLAFVFGEVVSERVRRDTLISALTFRLGLPYDLQAEAYIPHRYEYERVVRVDFQETSNKNSGLGDLEFALTRQLMREKGWLPDLLGTVRWRTTTGETDDEIPLGPGFHGIQGLLTGVKIRDPLAFFGSLSYTANLSDTRQGQHVEPGATWGFNLGSALALTPESTVNVSWEQRFTDRTKLAGEKVPGSAVTVGNLRFGITYALSSSVVLDLGVAVGLTRDAPDVQAMVALPIRFSPFDWR